MESKEYFEKVMQDYNRVLYQKWFTDGKFLKPEFEQCKVTHEQSKETLILILSTSVQTKIRI